MNKYKFKCFNEVPLKEHPKFKDKLQKPKEGLLGGVLSNAMSSLYEEMTPINEIEIIVRAQDVSEALKKVKERVDRKNYVLSGIEYCD